MLQVVEVDKVQYNVFFDDGCGSATTTKRAVDKLKDRAFQLSSAPIEMGGVGRSVTYAQHGLYKMKIPTINGRNAQIVAPCFDEVTTEFPQFPLQRVTYEMRVEARLKGITNADWPSIHETCGGKTDIMIGQKYRRYYPVEVQRLPSGLAIFRSHFYGPNKTNGILGSPSRVITEIAYSSFPNLDQSADPIKLVNSYLSTQMQAYENGYKMDLDIYYFLANGEDLESDSEAEESSGKLEDERLSDDIADDNSKNETYSVGEKVKNDNKEKIYLSKNEKQFRIYDEAGCNVDYRCPRCRGCQWCLNDERLNAVSLQEEGEQYAIEEAVTVDIQNREIRAKLPLSADPGGSLGENYFAASKVFKQ